MRLFLPRHHNRQRMRQDRHLQRGRADHIAVALHGQKRICIKLRCVRRAALFLQPAKSPLDILFCPRLDAFAVCDDDPVKIPTQQSFQRLTGNAAVQESRFHIQRHTRFRVLCAFLQLSLLGCLLLEAILYSSPDPASIALGYGYRERITISDIRIYLLDRHNLMQSDVISAILRRPQLKIIIRPGQL
jgi:hypothetical protein